MNEVKGMQATVSAGLVSASSKGADKTRASAEGGNGLPAKQVDIPEAGSRAAAPEDLGQAVAKMNDYIQSERRDLLFSIDEASGETVIRVLDTDSGDLIRQIPNEQFLKMAESLANDEGLHLISVQG